MYEGDLRRHELCLVAEEDEVDRDGYCHEHLEDWRLRQSREPRTESERGVGD